MADTEVKQLLLQVDASVELLRRNLSVAEKRVAGFEASVKSSTAKTDAHFSKLGTGLAGIKGHLANVQGLIATAFGSAAVTAIGAAITSALDYASALGETAQQLGVTTKELQEYRYAASQVGIEQEEMDKALAKLTRTMGEADAGGKKQAAVFEQLGLKLRDSSGAMKTAGALIPEIAGALEKVTDPARRAAIEVELFGKTGQKLDTLLAGGKASVDGLREAAHKLGLVLSDKQIQDADAAADKLTELKKVLEAKIAVVVANNAGSIIKLADAIGNLVDKVSRLYEALDRLSNSSTGKALDRLNTAAKLLTPLGMVSAAGGRIIDALAAEPGAAPAPKAGGGGAPAKAYPGVGKPAATGVSGKIDPSLLMLPGKFGKTGLAADNPGLFGQFGVGGLPGNFLTRVTTAASTETLQQEAERLAGVTRDQYEAQMDALRDQYDLADSTAERRRLALEMVDLDFDQREAQVRITTADQEAATIALAALADRRAMAKKLAERDNEGPGLRYLRGLTEEANNLGDAFQGVAVRGLEDLDRSLSDTVKTALGLHGIFGNIIGDLIEIGLRQAVIGPLASLLFGGSGGGGGLLGSIFGGFRASGGPVSAGQAYVVGEKRPELFVPRVPGVIVPQVSAGGGGGGVTIPITINAPGATAETVSMMRREMANWAPTIIQAATAHTTREMNRRRL